MNLPFFYHATLANETDDFLLSEETSHHVIQVLRMKEGEQLQLTDGMGLLVLTEIITGHKKKTSVHVLDKQQIPKPSKQISIAISPVKNNTRFEWFLEKATEIGVSQIIPLICQRTEKQHLRMDRLQGILISAMLQSQQTWLPELSAPTSLKDILKQKLPELKFVAHCESSQERRSYADEVQKNNESIILIGPEGDFTNDEISDCLSNGFVAVNLGERRLRTETAGVVVAALGMR